MGELLAVKAWDYLLVTNYIKDQEKKKRATFNTFLLLCLIPSSVATHAAYINILF